jgi:hypothetical protein
MPSGKSVEHFITLFDSKFLPMGMCLHHSLVEHAQPFHLWIICMDELVERQLHQLDLPHVTLLSLREVETPALLEAKKDRGRGEYCWTLTPFTPEMVFDRAPDAERVTYLDADLFFFSSPALFFDELEQSGRHVLITEHAYAPEHIHHAEPHGRFCVQFMTFRRTVGAYKVMRHWQAQCLAWCYAREEEGKFGDQKYLDAWPEQFCDEVHILSQVNKTLAPWNVHHFSRELPPDHKPVIYHFHALRLVSPTCVTLFEGYKIGAYGRSLYHAYLTTLKENVELMRKHQMPIPFIPPHSETYAWLRYSKRMVCGTMARARI